MFFLLFANANYLQWLVLNEKKEPQGFLLYNNYKLLI